MINKYWILVLTVAITVMVDRHQVKAACQSGCTCGSNEYECRNAGLTSVPSDIQSSVATLTLSNNKIAAIGDITFYRLTNLTSLDLSNNVINYISPRAFSRLKKLRYLSLQINKLSNLNVNLFQDLPDLRRLTINDNQVSNLPVQLFAKNPLLETINFQSNSLTNLPRNIFKNLRSLSTLTLSNNPLIKLESDIFEDLTGLLVLKLSNANLTGKLSADLFKNLISLVQLDIFSNEITELPFGIFSKLSGVSSLDFSHNKIQSITDNVFSNMTSLLFLKINNNPFYCDCNLIWLKIWLASLSSRNVAVYHEKQIQCSKPDLLAGRSLLGIASNNMRCEQTSPTPTPSSLPSQSTTPTKATPTSTSSSIVVDSTSASSSFSSSVGTNGPRPTTKTSTPKSPGLLPTDTTTEPVRTGDLTPGSQQDDISKIAIGAGAGGFVLICLVIMILYYLHKRRIRQKSSSNPEEGHTDRGTDTVDRRNGANPSGPTGSTKVMGNGMNSKPLHDSIDSGFTTTSASGSISSHSNARLVNGNHHHHHHHHHHSHHNRDKIMRSQAIQSDDNVIHSKFNQSNGHGDRKKGNSHLTVDTGHSHTGTIKPKGRQNPTSNDENNRKDESRGKRNLPSSGDKGVTDRPRVIRDKMENSEITARGKRNVKSDDEIDHTDRTLRRKPHVTIATDEEGYQMSESSVEGKRIHQLPSNYHRMGNMRSKTYFTSDEEDCRSDRVRDRYNFLHSDDQIDTTRRKCYFLSDDEASIIERSRGNFTTTDEDEEESLSSRYLDRKSRPGNLSPPMSSDSRLSRIKGEYNPTLDDDEDDDDDETHEVMPYTDQFLPPDLRYVCTSRASLAASNDRISHSSRDTENTRSTLLRSGRHPQQQQRELHHYRHSGSKTSLTPSHDKLSQSADTVV